MKNSVYFNPFLAMSFLLCILTGVYGRADTLTSGEKREVAPYNQLRLEGAFIVTLIQGTEESVIVDAASELAAQISTKSVGGTLRIYSQKEKNRSGKIHLTVHFKNLKEIDCSGAVVLNGSGAMKFDDLLLDASGACNTTMEITASSLRVDISGAGNTALTGKVSSIGLDISGAGKFMASELIADAYSIDLSGSGTAEVNAAKSLDVEVSGSGNVKYIGAPKISMEISGPGKVTKM